MRNTQLINKDIPLEQGFMRNGFFAWPMRKYKCKSCGIIFLSQNGNVHRCQECRPKHEKTLQRRAQQKRKMSR